MTALVRRLVELVPALEAHRVDPDSDRQAVIYGPPGTGKTTAMLALVNAHLEAGADPARVGIFTFTRNARAEAAARIKTATALDADDLPWLRTIHSACYRLLGLGRENVMQPDDYLRFGKAHGYQFTLPTTRDLDDPYGQSGMRTLGDWCLMAEDVRRARRWSVAEAHAVLGPRRPSPAGDGWSLDQAQLFSDRLGDYKVETGLLDYSDMLERVLAERLRPGLSHLFVDEAQDLTPLQWAVIDLWGQDCRRIFAFGDDDQALYEWSGADPQSLIGRPGHQLVLSVSYRLRAEIHRAAARIVKRIGERVPKEFSPFGPGGQVLQQWGGWLDARIPDDGSVLVLARNRAHLEGAREQLRDLADPFRDRMGATGIPDPATPRGRAIKTAVELGSGNLVLGRSDIRNLRRHLRAGLWPGDVEIPRQSLYGPSDLPGMGAAPQLVKTLEESPLSVVRLPPGEQDYLQRVIRRHGAGALAEKPRIELSTVHGVKGEEADHVICSTAMTRQTYAAYCSPQRAQEHRVFYVAATRARESLQWVITTAQGYEL